MVECRLSQAESGQLFRLCRDLVSAGSPREPQRDRDTTTGAAARPAEGQRSQAGLATTHIRVLQYRNTEFSCMI